MAERVEKMSGEERSNFEVKLRKEFNRFKQKDLVNFLENFCLKKEYIRYCSTKPETILACKRGG